MAEAGRPLAGKVAVVTGSGRRRGLGEAIVRRLARDGAQVVLSDVGRPRDASTGADHIGAREEMAQIEAEIRADGGVAASADCDVRVPAEVEALADFAVQTFGGLDIWVNNAGIGYIMKPLLEVSEADWDAVLDVNLKGCFLGMQA
ncbi:MAG: SDR family NAD(P)-dependent oxidoreductase, partial [Caulobacterales bacterium]